LEVKKASQNTDTDETDRLREEKARLEAELRAVSKEI
jgi:hypothetical protein